MASVFTKIVRGEIPSYKIAEDEQFYAFFDINPLAKGHTLVVPKLEVDYIFDLDDKMLADMMVFSKKVAAAIKAVVPCNRVGVAVVGLEVPHCHIHLCPINNLGDLNFSNPKISMSPAEFKDLASKISAKVVL